MKPKALIFDIGNVILKLDDAPMFETWNRYSKTKPSFVNPYFELQDTAFAFEKGEISAEEFASSCCRICGLNITYEEFCEGFNSLFTGVFEELEGIIIKLKKHYDLFALSNTNEIHVKYFSDKYPVFKYFNKLFFSNELGTRKPEPLIYQKTLEITGLKPEEVLFFDDLPENIQEAEKQGITSFHVTQPEPYIRELKRILNET